MKRESWITLAITCTLACLIFVGAALVHRHIDHQNCLCSQLTTESQQYPIDEKLLAIYDGVDKETGVFILFSTQCKHGVSLRLTVYPDEGYYLGERVDKKRE